MDTAPSFRTVRGSDLANKPFEMTEPGWTGVDQRAASKGLGMGEAVDGLLYVGGDTSLFPSQATYLATAGFSRARMPPRKQDSARMPQPCRGDNPSCCRIPCILTATVFEHKNVAYVNNSHYPMGGAQWPGRLRKTSRKSAGS
jgi:hypothetical protein